jgi:hypothetical protein
VIKFGQSKARWPTEAVWPFEPLRKKGQGIKDVHTPFAIVTIFVAIRLFAIDLFVIPATIATAFWENVFLDQLNLWLRYEKVHIYTRTTVASLEVHAECR